MKKMRQYLLVAFLLPMMTFAQIDRLEVVAELPFRPGNVAVSASGRVFATVHPLGGGKLQLIEVLPDKTWKAYPSAAFQKNGKPATDEQLDTPLGLVVDKRERLWVIDMGQELGKTRLWCFDLATNQLCEKIELPGDIAPKGSFIQDLAVDDERQWAYLADIAHPGIIAVNLQTKAARRFSGHAALQAEDKDMIIDGRLVYFNGAPARVAVNPVTLSSDRETLYFGAMSGTTWWQVPARLLREGKSDTEIGAAITSAGSKPQSDGAATDAAGNHYFTDLQQHAISRLGTDGKRTIVLQDERLQWPDNISLGEGWLYISVNQLNTTPAFTGNTDQGKPPYFLYRFRL